jgi:protein farnesyltransferase subunit beta
MPTHVASPKTVTEDEQLDVEKTLKACFGKATQPLHRRAHVNMLRVCISRVSEKMQGLDCSRPWLCYWILHAADILGALDEVYETVPADHIADFILTLFVDDEESSDPFSDAGGSSQTTDNSRRKGFAGGPQHQIPHLAASYAAVSALSILQQPEAFDAIDRPAVQRWLVSLRAADGGFRMHRGGEVDIRASYCAAVVARLLHLDVTEVFPPHARRYLAECQTYEGGFGSCLDGGGEAHGGYTQCAVAAALLTNASGHMDVANLRRFCAMRQLEFEGGFCGRTNKLVDSCYSFWIGSAAVMGQVAEAAAKVNEGGEPLSVFELLLLDFAQLLNAETMEIDAAQLPQNDPYVERTAHDGQLQFDQRELAYYVLQCCQQPLGGGLQDKPSASVDFYHTCYSLSGLSLASNNLLFGARNTGLLAEAHRRGWLPDNTFVSGDDDDDDETGAAQSRPPCDDLNDALGRTEVFPYPPEDILVGEVPGPKRNAARGSSKHKRAPSRRRKQGSQLGASEEAATIAIPQLRPVNPMFNLCRDRVAWVWSHFRGRAATVALLLA